MPDTLAAKLDGLKRTAAQAATMRSQASAAHDFATTQLQLLDAELRKTGIDPEHAEEELAALEAQLDRSADELGAQLAAEVAELTRILELARQAQLVR